MKYFIVSVIILALMGLGGLIYLNQHAGSMESENKVQVVASFYPLYYFASQIGGGRASVLNITPAGAEPHDYEPTPQDVAAIENSKLLILNGGGLEAWGSAVQNNLKGKNITIVIAGEGLTNQQVEENGQMTVDPHVWLSPRLAQKMADKIAAGFIQADPANENYYRSNADTLNNKLAELDTAFRQGLVNCQKKDIVTSHAAFGYLAKDYGLNQIPIAGLSPDAEPSPRQIANIVKLSKAHDVKFIFFEDLASPKLSQTIAAEVGAKTLVLSSLEGLSNEEMQKGEDYFSKMRENLANLKIALECTP